jgi:ABC-2 type transport system ATP-binding protein
MLMNLIEPASGSATVLGIDSRKLRGKHFEQIGYVSENQDQPGWMTLDYLLRYLKPFYPSWDQEYAAELVKQFDLPTDRPIKHMSRGMQMKAALASSMAYRPKLLILDEPFSGLDPLTRDEVIEALVGSAPETTIVISSHDLGDIETFASHIGFLNQGRLDFSEELATLAGRFREIAVTVSNPVLPAQWPAQWLRPETSPAVVRFVDTQFDADHTPEKIRAVFHGVTNVETAPMPLRSIFVALARGARAAA